MAFWDRFKKSARSAAPAHSDVGAAGLSEIAGRLRAACGGGVVDASALERFGRESGLGPELVYAALGANEAATLRTEHESQFVVCVGNCRDRGALACLSRLLEIRGARVAAGTKAFDVVPRACLARCQVGPAVEVRTPDGTAVLSSATPADMSRAVEELMDEA